MSAKRAVEGTSYKVVPIDSLTEYSNGNNLTKETDAGSDVPVQTRVYRRRWAMLAIFVLVSMSSAFQWIQFSIITNLIVK